MSANASSRPPTFERLGRAYHLRIRTAADFPAILDLDDALWMALSAPAATLRTDPDFLEYLDSDGDGQIAADDVRRAIRWLQACLHDTSGVRAGHTALELAAVSTQTEDGACIAQAARKILAALGSEAGELTLEQVREVEEAESRRSVSEAGVVLPEAAEEERVVGLITAILATQGGRPHPSGDDGIDEELLEAFLAQARSYLDWQRRAEPVEGATPILPLGEKTADAYALFVALRPKVEQYFELCDAAQLDPDLAERHVPPRGDDAAADLSSAAGVASWLAEAFLARPRADGILDLEGAINPHYGAALARLRAELLVPVLGEPCRELTRDGFCRVTELLVPHEAWMGERPDTRVADLALAELRAYVEDPACEAAVRALIARSHEMALVLHNLRLTERLILYQAFLLPLVNSFVSFPDLYDPHSSALFEVGTLILGGRHFTLSVKVLDRARHKKFSAESNVFMLYVEVLGPAGGKLYEVGVPVTSGGRGKLQVGQNGIFHDREGHTHQARVLEMVENPISMSEAVRSPVERLIRAVRGRIEKISAAGDQKLEAVGAESVTQVQASAEQARAPAPAAARGLGTTLAGGGIAVAALGSSVAFITNTLEAVSWTAMAGVLLAAILAALVPSTVIALFKLRRRNLSALLEGSGWGVNVPMYLTRRQSRTFTFRPAYPPALRAVRLRWWLRLLAGLAGAGLIGALLYWLAGRQGMV